MICKKCGTKLIEDERFCRGCGTLVSELMDNDMIIKEEEKPVFEPIIEEEKQTVEEHILEDEPISKTEIEIPMFAPIIEEKIIEEVKPFATPVEEVTPILEEQKEENIAPIIEEQKEENIVPIVEEEPTKIEDVTPNIEVVTDMTNEELLSNTTSIPAFVSETPTEEIKEEEKTSLEETKDNIVETIESVVSDIKQEIKEENIKTDKKVGKNKTTIILLLVLLLVVAYAVYATLNTEEVIKKEIVNKEIYKITSEDFTYNVTDEYKYEITDGKLKISDKENTWVAEINVLYASYDKVFENKDKIISEVEKAKYNISNTKEQVIKERNYLTNEISKDDAKGILLYTKANQVYTFEIIVVRKDNTINYDVIEKLSSIIDTAIYGNTPLEVVNTDLKFEINSLLFR